MDPKSLRERLAKLHAELAKAHQQDPATRQSLGEILTHGRSAGRHCRLNGRQVSA